MTLRKSKSCSTKARFCALLTTLGVLAPAEARMLDTTGKLIDAFRVDDAPLIDGKLDDDAWAFATVVDDLHQVNPAEYEAPSEKSRIFIVYTSDALYVAARFFDTEPDKITAQVLRQGDYSAGEDSFTVIIDPFNKERSGYAFDLNANGVRNQALYSNVTEENWQWDGIWHGATSITETGWVAEMEIPFKTLSFDPRNDTWGLNFARYIGRKWEHIGWVSSNRTQNPAVSGKIRGMQGMHQGVGLDVVPGIRTGQHKDYLQSTTETDLEPTLDLFYKLSSALTAALTVNTDFSGTGADARQINLTRFGLFFPERRGFFLQDADIFEFGRISAGDYRSRSTLPRAELESGRPFFSRRIGLTDDGQAVDINVGGKLTGRAGPFDVGVLAVSQAESTHFSASDLFVARVSANVLEESSVGMVLTHGDPNSDLRNTLAGLDFRYTNTRLPGGRSLEAALWLQRSDTEGREGDDLAYGFSVKVPNSIGWRGALGFKELQENFNPALGFVNRRNVRDQTAEFAYIWLPQTHLLREIYAGIDYEQIDAIGGGLQSRVTTLRPLEVSTPEQDRLRLHYVLTEENLDAPFEISEGVTIPAGAYQFDSYCVRADTAEFRPLRGEAYYCGGEFYDGAQDAAGLSLLWRPNAHFKFVAAYDINAISLPYGSFITRLASLRADIAFTNTWYWENLFQYDNVSYSLGLNSILRWVPRAGREMVFVVNREYVDFERDSAFTVVSGDVRFKFSYTFRF